MLNFSVPPSVAGDNGYAQKIDVGRLQEDEQRRHVGTAGSGGILVCNHQALLSACGERDRSG